MLALALLVLLGDCQRLADEPVDFQALREDACEQACETMDTCDPDRFKGLEPEDCFDRCMTLMPRLYEENQCGSRQINALRCIGGLTCEQFAAHEAGNNLAEGPPDYTAPCVAELHQVAPCSTHEPFDLDEPVPEIP
jgi:hypothetical protein